MAFLQVRLPLSREVFPASALSVWIFLGTAVAAPPNVIWSKSAFGGAQCVQPATGGGFLGVGSVSDTGNRSSVHFARMDGNGDTLWTRNYTLGARSATGSFLIPAGNGFLAVGSIATPRSSIWLLRLDGNGDTLWTRVVGDPNVYLYGLCVLAARDGGFVVSGTAERTASPAFSRILLQHFDANGAPDWQQRYGGDSYLDNAEGVSVAQTGNGGYAVCGGAILLRTDSSGTQLDYDFYQTWVNGHGSYNNVVTSVAALPDGRFALSGYSPHPDYFIPGMNTYNAWLGFADSAGRQTTYRTFGLGRLYHVLPARTGGFLLVGSTSGIGAGALAVRTDSTGAELWSGAIPGSTANQATAYDDSTFVSAGSALFNRFGPPVPTALRQAFSRRMSFKRGAMTDRGWIWDATRGNYRHVNGAKALSP